VINAEIPVTINNQLNEVKAIQVAIQVITIELHPIDRLRDAKRCKFILEFLLLISAVNIRRKLSPQQILKAADSVLLKKNVTNEIFISSNLSNKN
jgi:hypothetical protein